MGNVASSIAPASSQRFQAVFEEASRVTGTRFDFLLRTAQRESGMRADAKAPTSSATGLFQFIEKTWLETMKEAGPQLGYGKQASQISQVGDKYYVQDRKARQEILALRNDPKASALMAGAYARKNEMQLAERLGRQIQPGELYAAHFLGAQGGGRLIELAQSKPDLAANKVFPEQARANKNIFYAKNGKARSVKQVYDNLVATVPAESSQPLAKAFNLADRFKPKASMQVAFDPSRMQQASPMEQFFSKPAKPSRYGLGYAAEPQRSDVARASRIGQDGDDGFVAAVRGRASRYATEMKAEVPSGEKPAFEMALPRRKPMTGDVYADSLDGMLPRAKPTARPMDVSEASLTAPRAEHKPAARHGALDLSSFLNGDVFSSRDKA